MALCTLKYVKRLAIVCSYHNKANRKKNQKTHIHTKEHRKIFGTDGYDYHFDCGDGIQIMSTCKLNKMCIVNTYIFSYVNCTQIKLKNTYFEENPWLSGIKRK